MPLHVELSSGGVFSGNVGHALDLSPVQLRERFLDKRATGEEVWLQGKAFPWPDTTMRVFEGPASGEIPDFSPLLGPSAYALSGNLREVTDYYVTGPPGDTSVPAVERPLGEAVFLVHGSQKGAREEVARFLGIVIGDPRHVVILHEQPNRGRTLVEKVEQSATGAQYAVVVLTGDDEAHAVGDSAIELRGRQNVVFELGFFFGKLGRERVTVLYEPNVALPSDVAGLAYVELDESGGWKVQLARELKAAGIDASLDRLSG